MRDLGYYFSRLLGRCLFQVEIKMSPVTRDSVGYWKEFGRVCFDSPRTISLNFLGELTKYMYDAGEIDFDELFFATKMRIRSS